MKKSILFLIFFVSVLIMPSFFVSAQSIDNGTYTIISELNNDKVVDLKSAKVSNCNNIHLYDRNNTQAQKWIIKKNTQDNSYTIYTELNNNYALDIKNGKINNGSNIQLYRSNNTKAQKWIIKNEGDNTFSIRSFSNQDYTIDVASGKSANGTNIQLYKYNGTKAQLFRIEKKEVAKKSIDNGIYKILSAADNTKVMDVANGVIQNKTNIQLYQDNNTAAQRFEIEYLNNGYYKILSYLSNGISLDVANGSTLNRTNLQLYKYNGTDAQQWIIKENDDNTYSFISKKSGLFIYSSTTVSNGTNLWLYNNTDSITQKFKLEKLESPGVQAIKNGYYFINTKINNLKSLDIKNGYILPENNIQIYSSNSTLAQKWYIEYIDNGYYSIKSNKDINYVMTTDDPNKSGSNVFIKSFENANNQRWIIKDLNNGYFSIVSKDNKYLDLSGAKTANGTNIQIYNPNNTDAQQFKLIPTVEGVGEQILSDGIYTIKSAINKDMVIEVAGGKTANGTNIQLYRSNATNAQKWYFKYINNGYYKITNLINLSKSLDVSGGKTVDNTNVQIYDSNDTYAQQWIIKLTEDGYYTISSNANNLNLTVENGQMLNKTNINMFHDEGSLSQKFKIEETQAVNKVIDVSDWQGNIDWNQVASSGIYGVILRIGWLNTEDSMFSTYIKEVQRLKIPYGIYIFSYATDQGDVNKEATFTKNMIKKYNLNPILGIYYDLESWDTADGYHDTMNDAADFERWITSYSSQIRSTYNYDVKIYASTNYINTRFNNNTKKYVGWVAEWGSSCSYTGDYKMWQYTSTGRVAGIQGNVDMSILYKF